jgi:hypothetical protein
MKALNSNPVPSKQNKTKQKKESGDEKKEME